MEYQSSPRVVDAVLRNRWLFLAIVIGFALVSAGVSYLTAGSATVSQRVALKATDEAGLLGVDPGSEAAFVRYLNQRALFMTSDLVLKGALEELSLDTPIATFRKSITAKPTDANDSILIEVTAATASEAAARITAVVQSYRDVAATEITSRATHALAAIEDRRELIELALEDRVSSTKAEVGAQAAAQMLSELGGQATKISVAQSQVGDGVSFVHAAEVDQASAVATVVRNTAIGVGIGGLLGAAVTWIREDKNRQLRDASSLAHVVSQPVLAEVDRLPDNRVKSPASLIDLPQIEYRLALAGLLRITPTGVVVVTGPPNTGCTTSAWQLANAAARTGLNVLLVDATPRSGSLTRLIGITDDDATGLTDLVAGYATLDHVIKKVDLGYGVALFAVPADRTYEALAEIYRDTAVRKLFDEMRSAYDLIIVDAPSPAAAPEATQLISTADSVVVTVRHSTRLTDFVSLHRKLSVVGGNIAGYLLTFKPTSRRGGP